MSDLLGDLVGRSLGVRPVVRPRLPSVFERPGRELEADAPAPAASPSPERLVVSAPPPTAPPAAAVAPSPRAPKAVPPAHERAAAAPLRRAVESQASELPRHPPVRTESPSPPPAPAVSRGEASAIEHRLVVERPAPAPHASAGAVERSSVTEAVSPPVRTVETRTVDRLRIERRAERPSPPSREVRSPGFPGAAEPEQIVHVHIGRIDVRAPAPPKPPRRAPSLREPTLSLAAYLGDGAKGTR